MSDPRNMFPGVHSKEVEPAIQQPATESHAFSTDEKPAQAWQIWDAPEDPSAADTLPSTFKPTSLCVYTQHSRGLWQPTNGNNSSVFIIMMATRNNVDKYDWITEDDVSPLAHCATIADARKELQGLAQRYENATPVVENIELGHHFKIVGKHKTRTVWVKEVGHARSLKMVNLDDVDGGMYEDWIGNVYAENEDRPRQPFGQGPPPPSQV
ncbi:hypothetical protein E8E12_006288 [Didymella heteroderae]|uniref:Uncharacterized protein n=1 Tax=Didymella heteroderae TaxID=1769908 RepID=A0A9P4WJQ8_9PLEO|nr:hypothetical protein E8E12_006288 [Didymella heteroderae]